MATKKWFVVEGENEIGPLGPNGLRKLVRSGEVLPGSMIRREDHEFATRADHIRGLFHDDSPPPHGRAKVHGPFTSLRALGWGAAACMFVWVVIGVLGLMTAWSQRDIALQIDGGAAIPLLDAGAPFLGLGSVVVAVLFFSTGVVFTYWLWCARINLPHLIHARIRFGPSWVIAGWFVPPQNLLRPYQVIDEVDRLSAEAVAEGDATVGAQPMLLVPWWLCTLLLVVAAVGYKLMPVATAADIAAAANMHMLTSVAIVLAAGFAAAIVLRVTLQQELAHANHPDPVQLHHDLGHKRSSTATA